MNHAILLDKLNKYGLRGNANKLLESYLTDRRQCVKINGSLGNYMVVKTGVPQGTILGPLLFILYVNDLLISMPEDVISSYADDTAVIITVETWTKVE